MGKTPPYIVNMFGDENTYDVLSYMSKEGFVHYLTGISDRFHHLYQQKPHPESLKLYYIAQYDFEAIKVGVAKNPYERLLGLQTGNPQKLQILYFEDPLAINDEIYPFSMEIVRSAFEEEKKQLRWLASERKESLMGEWIRPDDRTFRILIRQGFEILEKLEAEINGQNIF